MRLTLFLLRKKMPNGHIFRGKDRLVRKVSVGALDTLRRQYEQEQENMYYLRHPYLTEEQSYGHAQALGKTDRRVQWVEEKRSKFKDNVTLVDRLSHLKVKEAWD